jgi:hypothetical protein
MKHNVCGDLACHRPVTITLVQVEIVLVMYHQLASLRMAIDAAL